MTKTEKKRREKAEKLKKTRTYFDLQGNKISKEKFYKQKVENRYLYTINDSMGHLRLTKKRGERGEIDYKQFIDNVNKALGLQLDNTKSLIIIFYPGVDGCSLTGSTDKGRLRHWYKRLRKKANTITPTNLLFIYKTLDGLWSKDVFGWHEDPHQLIEKNFFLNHYPCGGEVIIVPKNKFISLYGEGIQEQTLNVLEKLK